MKFKGLQLFFLFIALSFIGCEEEIEDNCNETIICTEEFRTISLEITNSDGAPVLLDVFYTFYDSRKKFEYDLNDIQSGQGIYPVLTDAEMDEIEREGSTLIFVGEKNGVNIVEHQMVIGHDCCHIQLISGDNKIIVEIL